MATYSTEITLQTRGNVDLIDLTPYVAQTVRESGVREGLVTVFVPGSTAGVTTLEFERGVLHDFKATLERLVCTDSRYRHEGGGLGSNARSHVMAGLMGPSVSVPIVSGQLTLGTWQQIVLADCDIRPRNRRIAIQVFGSVLGGVE
jgi:secondary thiamine-phosphate synthase enzyme